MRKNKGFTLIELLVVIGILAVLLAITLIAINPTQQLESADDTKRKADVNAILNAINQYSVDNGGSLPDGITATAAVIGDGTGEVDLCSDISPTYIAALPQDPDSNNGADITTCTGYSTGYTVEAANGRVKVAAPDANTGTIEVTR